MHGTTLVGQTTDNCGRPAGAPAADQGVRPTPRPDSGFAMLLVFLMAAVAAIMLYMEMPRIAFETQRQKEQMLVERGEQYKRAIQLFLRANSNTRWPASMDELESFNGRRFLRRRYKDPMTGKDQWRLVHIQNGILTDSVNNKPPAKPGDQKNAKDALASQTVSDYGNTVGTYNANQGSGGTLNAAQRRRTSDSSVPGGSPFPGASGAGSGVNAPPDATQTAGQPVPGQTGTPPGFPGQGITPGVPGVPGLPGLPGQGVAMPGPGIPMPGVPGQIQVPTTPNNQSGLQQGGSTVGDYSSIAASGAAGSPPGALGGQYAPGMPGPPANSQNYGGTPAYPAAPGAQGAAPGYPQPGMSMNPGQPGGMPGQSGAATNLINTLLTTPRPGGMAGLNGPNAVIGGGIAGVASTADGESIMVYNNHTNYSEWEFIFDPAKQRYPPPNPLGGTIGTPASQLGSMGGSTPGTPASQLGTMPGSTPGAQGAGSTPFGAAPASPDIRGGHQ